MDVRFFSLPRAVPEVSTAFFVPPSIRPTQQGGRFSQGGPANPPQAKQRSLLARLLGRELEAGSYSTGEGSIPLKEVAKFPFAGGAIDVAVTPKDKIPRMVVSDGEKVYQYKIVNTKLEAEWSFSVRQLGRVISVYFVDLDNDGQFEIVGARHDPNIGISSSVLGVKDGKLVPEKPVRVDSSFRPMGATFSNVNGKDATRALAFIDEFNRLQITVEGEDIWRSGTAVGGGATTIEQLVPGGGKSSGGARSSFYKFEPNPLALDLDGDGIDEILVPQNIVKEGLLA